MTPLIDWLTTLCADADPAQPGFQASWLYIAWNVFFPAVFGVTVALAVKVAARLRGKKTC